MQKTTAKEKEGNRRQTNLHCERKPPLSMCNMAKWCPFYSQKQKQNFLQKHHTMYKDNNNNKNPKFFPIGLYKWNLVSKTRKTLAKRIKTFDMNYKREDEQKMIINDQTMSKQSLYPILTMFACRQDVFCIFYCCAV